jgi:luciferase family oxidoreductase group 1
MNTNFPVSILDQSPVVAGTSPRDAILATLALARRADALGYHRYWLAEHHSVRTFADPAPEVLLARVAAETTRLRVGTGGVLLPHTSALKVAEQFHIHEALEPGRIDLGIGRGVGGPDLVAAALGSREEAAFPRQMRDLIDFLDGSFPEMHPFASLHAMPTGTDTPEIWLLGKSENAAALAAEMGLPFAFAHFISGDGAEITRMYRHHFRASRHHSEPRLMLALSAIAAPSAEEAEELASSIALLRLRFASEIDVPVPTLEQTRAYPYTADDRKKIANNRRFLTLGTPSTVRERIEMLAAAHEADEVMIVTIVPDYDARLRSYELLADAFALNAPLRRNVRS